MTHVTLHYKVYFLLYWMERSYECLNFIGVMVDTYNGWGNFMKLPILCLCVDTLARIYYMSLNSIEL